MKDEDDDMRMNDKSKCSMNDSMSVYTVQCTRQVEFRCISPEIIQMVETRKLNYPIMKINFAKKKCRNEMSSPFVRQFASVSLRRVFSRRCFPIKIPFNP